MPILNMLLTVVGFAMSSLTLASTGSNFSLTCNNIWINDKDLELWNILYVQVGN